MSRIVEDDSKFETWKNHSQAKIVLKRMGRGGEITDEVFVGGKVIHLTPAERRYNQEMCASEKLDPFQNGLLTPVQLVENADDVHKLEASPNHITETEMAALFKTKSLKVFADRVNAVTNPIILGRLIEMARTDEVNASIRQVDILQARLQAEAPASFQEIQVIDNAPIGRGRVVTSKLPDPT